MTVALEHITDKINVMKNLTVNEFGVDTARDICYFALDFNKQPRRRPTSTPNPAEVGNAEEDLPEETQTLDLLLVQRQEVLDIEDDDDKRKEMKGNTKGKTIKPQPQIETLNDSSRT